MIRIDGGLRKRVAISHKGTPRARIAEMPAPALSEWATIRTEPILIVRAMVRAELVRHVSVEVLLLERPRLISAWGFL